MVTASDRFFNATVFSKASPASKSLAIRSVTADPHAGPVPAGLLAQVECAM